MAEARHTIQRLKFMGGGAAFPNNYEKGRAEKRKTKNADCLRDASTGEKKCNACMDSSGPYNMFIK